MANSGNTPPYATGKSSKEMIHELRSSWLHTKDILGAQEQFPEKVTNRITVTDHLASKSKLTERN